MTNRCAVKFNMPIYTPGTISPSLIESIVDSIPDYINNETIIPPILYESEFNNDMTESNDTQMRMDNLESIRIWKPNFLYDGFLGRLVYGRVVCFDDKGNYLVTEVIIDPGFFQIIQDIEELGESEDFVRGCLSAYGLFKKSINLLINKANSITFDFPDKLYSVGEDANLLYTHELETHIRDDFYGHIEISDECLDELFNAPFGTKVEAKCVA